MVTDDKKKPDDSRRLGVVQLSLSLLSGVLRSSELIPSDAKVEFVELNGPDLLIAVRHSKLDIVPYGESIPMADFGEEALTLKSQRSKLEIKDDKIKSATHDWEIGR